MTTLSQIHIALMNKAKAFATANSLPINKIGFDFTEPSSGAWLELSIAPNDRDYGLNDTKIFRRGIGQINICNKKNNGIKQLADIAGLLEADFPKGLILIDAVRIATAPQTMEPFQRGSAYVLPLSFTYSE